jgi:hypothetical protein
VDRYRLLITAPAGAVGADGVSEIRIILEDADTDDFAAASTQFAGPER